MTALVVNLEVHSEIKRLQRENRLVPVVVVVSPVDAQSRIPAGAVALRDIPAGGRAKDAVSSLRGVVGFIASAKLYPGEQVLSPMVTTAAASPRFSDHIPPGYVAMSLLYNPVSQAAGQMVPGDRVAVLAILGKGYSGLKRDTAQIIVKNVLVMSVPSGSPGSGAAAAIPSSRSDAITLAVTPAQASQIAFAAAYGQLNLVLESSQGGMGSPSATRVTDATVLKG